MEQYNRQRLIENLHFFAKKKGYEFGYLEKQAGISAGYMSKLIKDDSKGKIDIKVVCKFAEILGQSIDTLVYSRTKTFTFREALDEMQRGKCMTMKSRTDNTVFKISRDRFFMEDKETGFKKELMMSDMLALTDTDDWIVVEEGEQRSNGKL